MIFVDSPCKQVLELLGIDVLSFEPLSGMSWSLDWVSGTNSLVPNL